MRLRSTGSLRILDFDIENRPLSYLGSDFTTSDITAIAWGFVGEKSITAFCLGECSQREMLEEFVKAYDAAGIVSGHYIRKHDLPVINGALMEHGLPPLKPKLTSDTKLDLKKRAGLSMSQEALSAMYGLKEPKVHMNQHGWREANRLTPEGIRLTRQRVMGDVLQHQQLRKRLLESGMLGPPKMWSP